MLGREELKRVSSAIDQVWMDISGVDNALKENREKTTSAKDINDRKKLEYLEKNEEALHEKMSQLLQDEKQLYERQKEITHRLNSMALGMLIECRCI